MITQPLAKLNRGFSLLEMAVVLIILGFIIGALLLPLQAQRNLLFQSETQNTLETAKKALLGYAQSQGRLPCPATNVSQGLEQPLGGGACTVQDGFLPAATLGIQPTSATGFALDGWSNSIRYAVTQTNNANALTTHFTTTNEMSNQGITNLQPNLRVCMSSTGITATRCSGGTEANYLINNAVAVIYSLGSTGQNASGGADEDANLNLDPVFVSHDLRASDPNGGFDQMLTWISPYVLYNAMIDAGQLH
jgi:prepilin-type N-terminal cleavage/methylation domain-containing protein